MPYLREINNGWKNENMKKFGAKPEFFPYQTKLKFQIHYLIILSK